MYLTFGILSMLAGGLLLLVAILRLPFVRNSHTATSSFTIKILIVALVLIVFSVLMISHSQNNDTGINGMAPGTIIFFVGGIFVILGIWIAIFAPFSLRNTNNGLRYIFIGLLLLIGAIFIMSASQIIIPDGESISNNENTINMQRISSRRIGFIPFGKFALILFVLTNGLALRAHLPFNRTIGVNLLLLSLLMLVYAIGPILFRNW